MSREMKAILGGTLMLFACLCCLGIAGGSSLVGYWILQPIPTSTQSPTAANTAILVPSATPTGEPTATFIPIGSLLTLDDPMPPEAEETLRDLIAADPPAGDILEQAERLKHVTDIPRVVATTAEPIPLGTVKDFYVNNEEANENKLVRMELRYITPHVYFWVDKRVDADDDDIRTVAETFENEIYPTDRDFFGSEWTPGVDGDEHIYIAWSLGMSERIGGYFSPADEFSREVHSHSNEHEMIYVNAYGLRLDDEYVLATLAHEFQHMIHWSADRNEETWINEGFSELATLINHYDVGGSDIEYFDNPGIQLNTWVDAGSNEFGAHYGGSYMFITYFLSRFGREATQALVRSPLNGLAGIDDALAKLNLVEPGGKGAMNADDLMADFGAALLLQDPSIEDGRFGFSEYPYRQSLGDITRIKDCPTEKESKMVSQYGFRFYSVSCGGPFTAYFAGRTTQKVVSAEAQEDKYYVWSNRGDESDMILTRTFDLPADGTATLEFDLWYNLEEDYDYVYLEASVDGGATWTILKTRQGTSTNPQGNNFGWGWTGTSGGGSKAKWATESVDLSEYAGQQVQIRFEYVTDPAVNGEGFIVDNIRIPEIDYVTDFESGLDGWEAEGFVRIQNLIPQSYRVLIVHKGERISVEEMALDNRMSGFIHVTPEAGEKTYVVILGTARYTEQKAPYQFIILS